MKELTFVSDFFLEDGVLGGAELYNHNLLQELKTKYNITRVKSHLVDGNLLNNRKNSTFIVSNFMNLPGPMKEILKLLDYIILEHDHKYVATNDPSKFVNMIAPRSQVINQEFFHKARAVFCQSKIHAEVLQKNLLLDRVVNLSCNLWSDEQLELLKTFTNSEKKTEYAYLQSGNRNKGMPAAVKFCKDNQISAHPIPNLPQEQFFKQLSGVEKLIFFPQWLESFNRLVVEAKILGCKIVTNKLLGVASEKWFRETKAEDLIATLREKRDGVLGVITTFIEGNETKDLFIDPIKVPKITIITSLYKASAYIENFMKNITSQTVFDKCELLILDANSPDGEYESCIKYYEDKFSNIKYTKLPTRVGVQETMNLGIEMSTGEILTIANVDDLRLPTQLEEMSKLLAVDEDCDLVYSDCYEVDQIVSDVSNFRSKRMYEHSRLEFSKENMIKCLPGPMPMWRKSIHKDLGNFDTTLKYAADWDMWLRAVRSGCKFKKFEKALGLYYNNPKGLSTSQSNSRERFEEERLIFNRNKDIFGKSVTQTFEGYFNGS